VKLVNYTAVPARTLLTTSSDPERRLGMVIAKATFRIDGSGEPQLDTQDPHPIYDEDRETELGLLPADLLPRKSAAFEVILLGAAHCPADRPVVSRTVGLAVGDVARTMIVHGDRIWQRSMGGWSIGAAQPFVSMPLVWERAFGGRCDVWIDRDAKIEVSDPLNARGRGFDPSAQAELFAGVVYTPGGFPQVRDPGLLPNLEDAAAPIARRSDRPDPTCWATLPRDIGFATLRPSLRDASSPHRATELEDQRERLALRAHPDWILALPPAGGKIRMHGLSREEVMAFPLPRLRVFADYGVGDRSGALELRPQRLVLLPEERRLYLGYAAAFNIERPKGEHRSMRLRLAEGWFEPPKGATA
jgi:hypothetical protein